MCGVFAVFSATFPKQADAIPIPLLEIPPSLEIVVGGRYRGDRENAHHQSDLVLFNPNAFNNQRPHHRPHLNAIPTFFASCTGLCMISTLFLAAAILSALLLSGTLLSNALLSLFPVSISIKIIALTIGR
ncbi:hypothetical protein P692DRAFT_20872666 [Suillus brevipes Sb2]|nr:hypothetical protein P692DRAFT_20872666 [Suillus brevipes Sb2]